MQLHPNAAHAPEAPIEGLVRTRYPLAMCVVCGYERIHTVRQETSCPQCGATARRSFALFRDLGEQR